MFFTPLTAGWLFARFSVAIWYCKIHLISEAPVISRSLLSVACLSASKPVFQANGITNSKRKIPIPNSAFLKALMLIKSFSSVG